MIKLSGHNHFEAARLDLTKSIDFYVHGWQQSYDQPTVEDVARQYVKFIKNRNICLVDWSILASKIYPEAAENSKLAGIKLAEFMKSLSRYPHFKIETMTCVGFSLGAHVCGVAGHKLMSKLNQIIGLDAAGPLFYSGVWNQPSNDNRLDASDAVFVQALHTSRMAGTTKPIANVDFYVNENERYQPGCRSGFSNITCRLIISLSSDLHLTNNNSLALT